MFVARKSADAESAPSVSPSTRALMRRSTPSISRSDSTCSWIVSVADFMGTSSDLVQEMAPPPSRGVQVHLPEHEAEREVAERRDQEARHEPSREKPGGADRDAGRRDVEPRKEVREAAHGLVDVGRRSAKEETPRQHGAEDRGDGPHAGAERHRIETRERAADRVPPSPFEIREDLRLPVARGHAHITTIRSGAEILRMMQGAFGSRTTNATTKVTPLRPGTSGTLMTGSVVLAVLPRTPEKAPKIRVGAQRELEERSSCSGTVPPQVAMPPCDGKFETAIRYAWPASAGDETR